MRVVVNAVPAIRWRSQSNYPTITPAASQEVSINFVNSGNVPLYDDTSLSIAPTGTKPTHLATSCPLNSNSDLSAGWTNPARPAVNFAAVYEADGVTLAANQHVALPGQIVKFSFSLSVPAGYAASTYRACFQPVLEGTESGYFPNLGVYLDVTVPSVAIAGLSGYPTKTTVTGGEPTMFNMNIKNLGNVTIPSGSTITTSNGGAFQDPSWADPATLAIISQNLAPLASTNSGTLTLLAPSVSATTSYTIDLAIQKPSGSAVLLVSDKVNIPATVNLPSYSVAFVGQSAYPTITYGQSSQVYLSYKNTGNVPWRDDVGLSGQNTRNNTPFHLATSQALNRVSGFADTGWTNPARPAVNFAAVYEADGVTLAANQHVALPGQIVKFSFSMTPQNWVRPGAYREYFQPIAEGTADGATNSVGTYLVVTIPTPEYKAQYFAQSSYPTVTQGQSAQVYFMYKNVGTVSWYDNTSISQAPQGMGIYPIHLATSQPLNRSSKFYGTGWTNPARPAVNFAAVYEADGVTLASNQHVVLPGQVAKFSFSMTAPSDLAPGTYREYFIPVAEGTPSGSFNDPGTYLDVMVK